MIKCADGTLYTGIALDVDARIEKHTQGTGAKYTRGRGPFTLILREAHANKNAALMREAAIKKLTRSAKLALCNT